MFMKVLMLVVAVTLIISGSPAFAQNEAQVNSENMNSFTNQENNSAEIAPDVSDLIDHPLERTTNTDSNSENR
jgi:hypothetical protein